LTDRNSAVFSMDGIFSASSSNNHQVEEVVGWYDVYSSSSKDVLVTAENPIHSRASAQPTAVVEAVDDDAALYLEYQNLQDSQDNTLYDKSSNEDTEVVMTFEEWKTKRKQFKQGNTLTHSLTHSFYFTHSLTPYIGTRGSFVKAFQMFEEREKVALDSLEASESVKNTLKLHSTKVKNVLANTRVLGAANNKPK
jgi:hypothetical protein